MDVNGVHQLFGNQHSLNLLLLCSAEERTLTDTGLKQLEGE